MKTMNKKGDSELLSFVLLIILVIIVGVIVMMYAKTNTKTMLESTDDLDKTLGLSQVCNEVSLKVLSCSCQDGEDDRVFCDIAFVSDSKRQIKEITYDLIMNNQRINPNNYKSEINLKPLSGYILEDIEIKKGTHPTRVELRPTKVIFNKEINCGSKVSVGNCNA